MLIGRDRELSVLETAYKNDEFEFAVIYGRRRIGKTSLISEFVKNKNCIFFSALKSSSNDNLVALSQAISSYSSHEYYTQDAPIYQSFDSALDHITSLSDNERIIFVIDEYPYLARSYEGISSKLQHIIDHSWKNKNIFLILCGSSMSFMQHQVLGNESPLYGRRTLQIKLQPLPYIYTQKFNPNWSFEDSALVYGITGGIPHYINQLKRYDDVDIGIKNVLFDPSGYLFEEPENLLKQELREPSIYNSIIRAVAFGATHSNEIASKVGIASNVCSKYIKSLLDIEILDKLSPISEKEGRKTIYVIRDNLFLFWYRFIPGMMSAIQTGYIDKIYDLTVKNHYPDYMGHVFEKICREYMLSQTDKLPIPLLDIGTWWGSDKIQKKEIEIDMVGIPTEGKQYIIGSCKYRNKKVGADEYYLMQDYARVFGKGELYHYYFFSKAGFTSEMINIARKENLHLITPDIMS